MNCTLSDWYQTPAIPLYDFSNHTQIDEFGIEYAFNSYGYRTQEFTQPIPEPYILTCGCSLTTGVALEINQTWVHKLENHLGVASINLAKGGANSDFVAQNLLNWLQSSMPTPILIIAQWPNPYRFINWNGNCAEFVFNRSDHNLYKYMLKNYEFNFWHNWVKNIIWLNNSTNVPIINVALEFINDIPVEILDLLDEQQIKVHFDEKKPGATWHFDSGAPDKSHHSEWCNSNWADRILTIYNKLL